MYVLESENLTNALELCNYVVSKGTVHRTEIHPHAFEYNTTCSVVDSFSLKLPKTIRITK